MNGLPVNLSTLPKWLTVLFCYISCYDGITSTEAIDQDTTSTNNLKNAHKAYLNISYNEPGTNIHRTYKDIEGIYGHSSTIDQRIGLLVHVRTVDNNTQACGPIVNVPSSVKWIALVKRGGCQFRDKIFNTAINNTASAVIVYDNQLKPNENVFMSNGNITIL